MLDSRINSRTSLGLRNGSWALCYHVVALLVGFASRKVFLDRLGADVLGINTTAQNLLGMLNLSELGIGVAVSYLLYRPLAVGDRRSIGEIVALQGWLYRRIACIVAVGAVLLSLSFPWLFGRSGVPLWMAYASFVVFLYSSLLTYCFNYRQILLTAGQQQWQVVRSYQSVMLLRSVVQMAAVWWLPHGYVWWLLLHVLFATLASLNLHREVKRVYPYLASIPATEVAGLRRRYPQLIVKIKQVFFHHIASFALTQSSPLIIYAYANLTAVACYGNYMLIVSTLQTLCNSLFAGIGAGVGNLVAEGNRERIMQVFEELFSIRFFMACFCCFGLLRLTEPFVVLWLGAEYLLPRSVLYTLTAILYIFLTRPTVDSYIAAHGMYQDVAAPVCEAVLNIGLSIFLGSRWGISGILSGVLISLVTVVLLWKPYFLFCRGMHQSLWRYIRMYALHLLCAIGAWMVCSGLLGCSVAVGKGWFPLFGSALLQQAVFGGVLFTLLYLCTSGMRDFCLRIKQYRRV